MEDKRDAATRNVRSPMVVRRVRRTTSIDDITERSLHRAWESAGRLSSLVRYGGTDPYTHFNTSNASLKSISFFVFSQWSWRNSRVIYQTSTTSKLVEQLHSSLTEATEDVEEYWPVSRYRSPDDWGQVTSPVTEPRVWTLNGEWN